MTYKIIINQLQKEIQLQLCLICKKKKIFYQKLTFFHPNLKMLNRYDFASSRFAISRPNTSRNDKNIPCSPHFHLSWQFCRTNNFNVNMIWCSLPKGPHIPAYRAIIWALKNLFHFVSQNTVSFLAYCILWNQTKWNKTKKQIFKGSF